MPHPQVVEQTQRLPGEPAQLRVVPLALQLADHDEREHHVVLGEAVQRARVGQQDAGVEDVGTTSWHGPSPVAPGCRFRTAEPDAIDVHRRRSVATRQPAAGPGRAIRPPTPATPCAGRQPFRPRPPARHLRAVCGGPPAPHGRRPGRTRCGPPGRPVSPPGRRRWTGRGRDRVVAQDQPAGGHPDPAGAHRAIHPRRRPGHPPQRADEQQHRQRDRPPLGGRVAGERQPHPRQQRDHSDEHRPVANRPGRASATRTANGREAGPAPRRSARDARSRAKVGRHPGRGERLVEQPHEPVGDGSPAGRASSQDDSSR